MEFIVAQFLRQFQQKRSITYAERQIAPPTKQEDITKPTVGVWRMEVEFVNRRIRGQKRAEFWGKKSGEVPGTWINSAPDDKSKIVAKWIVGDIGE
jgi:hypothetical protein